MELFRARIPTGGAGNCYLVFLARCECLNRRGVPCGGGYDDSPLVFGLRDAGVTREGRGVSRPKRTWRANGAGRVRSLRIARVVLGLLYEKRAGGPRGGKKEAWNMGDVGFRA